MAERIYGSAYFIADKATASKQADVTGKCKPFATLHNISALITFMGFYFAHLFSFKQRMQLTLFQLLDPLGKSLSGRQRCRLTSR